MQLPSSSPAARPGGSAASLALRDGTTVVLRAIEPGDAAALVRFHETLSVETVRKRYFSMHPRLSPEELVRFTTVDHHTREALVLLDGEDIVAVGRYDGHAGSGRAEVAFVVRDDWQGRGAGTALLAALIDAARREGLTCLTASTLYTNQRMMDLFRRTGLVSAVTYESGVIEVELTLTAPAAG
jgi:GNAT superfamily N-acetyltransferase